MTDVVLVFDEESFAALCDGALPRTNLSHDRNLFQFGQACLRRGCTLHLTSNTEYLRQGGAWRLHRIYPRLSVGAEWIDFRAMPAPIVVSCHLQLFAWGQVGWGKKVAIHPALYFVEMPYTYGAEQTLSQLLAARHHADFLIVQNRRMKDILVATYGWLANWTEPDRILLAPLGLLPEEDASHGVERDAARRALRCAPDDIAIVNGGGTWRWTGFNDFLRGFITAVRGGADHLILFSTGFRQAANDDHGDYIAETRAILADNADLVGDRLAADPVAARRIRIHVEDDWEATSAKLPTFLAGADLGLNVNKGGLENWQAQRVRCLDYVSFGLPLLSTTGDAFSDLIAGDGALRLPDLHPDAAAATLAAIDADPARIAAARQAMSRVRNTMLQSREMDDALATIVATGRRRIDLERTTVLEKTWNDECRRVRDHISGRFQALMR